METFENKLELPDYPESWWLATAQMPSYARLTEDLTTESVVVGAGLTGITTAYMLAKAGLDVVLLESGRVLRGATAYSNGVATVQHGLIYADLLRRLGMERARLYYDANLEAMSWIRAATDAFGIDCDLTKENAYLYTADELKAETIYDEREAYGKLGIPGAYMDGVPLPIHSRAALKAEDQIRLNPIAYALFMLDEIERLGGRIYEHTTAVNMAESATTGFVETEKGSRVSARSVIACTHFPLNDHEGLFADMQATTTYSIAVHTEFEIAGGIYRSLDGTGRSVQTIGSGDNKRLLIGGETHLSGDGDSTVDHYAALLRYGVRNFGAKQVDYRWAASDFVVADKLPYIGRMPGGALRQFVATGFGHGGMTLGTAAAMVLRDLILERSTPYEELFSPARSHRKKGIGRFFAGLTPFEYKYKGDSR